MAEQRRRVEAGITDDVADVMLLSAPALSSAALAGRRLAGRRLEISLRGHLLCRGPEGAGEDVVPVCRVVRVADGKADKGRSARACGVGASEEDPPGGLIAGRVGA